MQNDILKAGGINMSDLKNRTRICNSVDNELWEKFKDLAKKPVFQCLNYWMKLFKNCLRSTRTSPTLDGVGLFCLIKIIAIHPPPIEAEAFWCFDGKTVSLEKIFNPAILKEAEKIATTSSG
jgi:hypothetical protein